VVLLAKEPWVHADLTRQFARRSVGKLYLAITRSAAAAGGLPPRGSIELPLSVGRKNRVRVAAPRAAIVADVDASASVGRWSVPRGEVFAQVRTYPASTGFATLWADGRIALLAVRPVTGRRHQIRVHLAWIGHPVVGDPLFGGQRANPPGQAAVVGAGERTCLHSWQLAFDAPWADSARVRVEAPPGDDFWTPLRGRLPHDHGDPAAVLTLEGARRAVEALERAAW
jgi:tRNA pseudouridine32 synthase/23S rRNA pseudouridine746 synthase